MNTTTINSTTSNTNTHNAGCSPCTPEAHQRAGLKGQKRVKAMNGSWLHMEHDGTEWVIYRVESGAPFVKTISK
jgi:hypothetical protein